MAVIVRPNPYHPTRDIAVLRDPWTAEEVASAADANPIPLSQKAVPGTSKHQRLMDAGATVYQQCPPLELDATTPSVKNWCDTHHSLPIRSLEELDVREIWTTWYEVIHRDWSPTAPHEVLLNLFAGLCDEIDVEHSVACTIDGEIIAVAFCFPGDEPPEILTEALHPQHPLARQAVASCMAAALANVNQVVRFDGHVSDPHFAPLWRSVPGVYAGESDPADLLEISGA